MNLHPDISLASRPESPVSNHDIADALAAKLGEIERCDAGEDHAHAAGDHEIASLFSRIASRDRQTVDELTSYLGARGSEQSVGQDVDGNVASCCSGATPADVDAPVTVGFSRDSDSTRQQASPTVPRSGGCCG